MHEDLDNIDKLGDYDVCIVGSGPAGLAVASKLINKGIKFIILESGEVNPNQQFRELNEGYSIGPRKLDLVNSRLRCVGGAGKLWAGVCRPFDPEEFDGRGSDFKGWPISYGDIEKYYKEAASVLGISYENFFTEDWREASQLAESFSSFAGTKGILRGVQYQRSSSKNRDLSNLYQDVLFNDKNCTFLTNATVTDIVQSEKDIVEYVVIKSFSGKEVNVRAKNFVLCAGAIENPRVLLDSSINTEIKNNKFVGACFMSHPAFRGAATLTKEGFLTKCENIGDNLGWDFGFEMNASERSKINALRHNIHLSPSTDVKVIKENASTYAAMKNNIELLMNYSNKAWCKLVGGSLDSKLWDLHISVEQEPRMSNHIKLSKDKDRHGSRKVEIFWNSVSDREMKTVSEAAKAVGREAMLTNVGMCRISQSLQSKEIFKQDDPVNHHIGTTRMAKSLEHGVVDSNLKIFGLSNLFISGSSVFPSSSIVNPTYTIIALSLRLGSHIANQQKSSR
jgi:choline dehydrogenase-like flavoprotein